MVRLPEKFIATKARGYFFNTENEILYSLKIDGILKPMKLLQPNPFNHMREPFFKISVNGNRRSYALSQLRTLAKKEKANPGNDVIPEVATQF
jgi:hypothetical protein